MRPRGCGLNQSQGQDQSYYSARYFEIVATYDLTGKHHLYRPVTPAKGKRRPHDSHFIVFEIMGDDSNGLSSERYSTYRMHIDQ